MAGATQGRQLVSQQLRIEATVAPRDALVIHVAVEDAVVMERHQQLFAHPAKQVALIDQIGNAKGKDIGVVGTVWSRGQTQQKSRHKVLQEAVIGRRRRMVKFIHNDVIEVLWFEALQMLNLAERLYRCTQHINRSEEHTSELQSRENLVCRLLLEK